jgi:hypothetical protein
MAYAVFPREFVCHLTRPNAFHTLCGLPTKGQRRSGPPRLPPARVTPDPPQTSFIVCENCLALSADSHLAARRRK